MFRYLLTSLLCLLFVGFSLINLSCGGSTSDSENEPAQVNTEQDQEPGSAGPANPEPAESKTTGQNASEAKPTNQDNAQPNVTEPSTGDEPNNSHHPDLAQLLSESSCGWALAGFMDVDRWLISQVNLFAYRYYTDETSMATYELLDNLELLEAPWSPERADSYFCCAVEPPFWLTLEQMKNMPNTNPPSEEYRVLAKNLVNIDIGDLIDCVYSYKKSLVQDEINMMTDAVIEYPLNPTFDAHLRISLALNVYIAAYLEVSGGDPNSEMRDPKYNSIFQLSSDSFPLIDQMIEMMNEPTEYSLPLYIKGSLHNLITGKAKIQTIKNKLESSRFEPLGNPLISEADFVELLDGYDSMLTQMYILYMAYNSKRDFTTWLNAG